MSGFDGPAGGFLFTVVRRQQRATVRPIYDDWRFARGQHAQNGALISSGTAFLNAQERVTNQSVVLTLNRQF
jgi:hypothetical protein